MPYIIDGHNLIPHIPGLHLSQIDDEKQLIEKLARFCLITRKQVEVYFDGAPVGQPKKMRFGFLTAHFTPQGKTADQAIRQRTAKLGRSAPNWTVVSSDWEVQSAARSYRCKVLSSADFAGMLLEAASKKGQGDTTRAELTLSEDEVQSWLDEFQRKPGRKSSAE